MIKYIIWDAGGTLFDTYPAMVMALSDTLKVLGSTVPDDEIEALLHISREHAFDVLTVRLGHNRDELERLYRETYAQSDSSKQVMFPGAFEVCELVRQHGGANFIATHRSREGLQRLLVTHGLIDMFRYCITSDDGYPRKPDPSVILAILDRFELNASEVLIVGDRAIDIEAGHKAGVFTCLLCRSSDCDIPADLVISDYWKLIAYLEAAWCQRGACV